MKKRILAILLIGISVFSLVGCGEEEKYKKALEAYNSKDYDEAVSLFEELGDYEDAKIYSVKCQYWEKYNEGIQLLSDGDYNKAYDVFVSTTGFEDSRNYLKKCSIRKQIEATLEDWKENSTRDTGEYAYIEVFEDMDKSDPCFEYMINLLNEKGLEYIDNGKVDAGKILLDWAWIYNKGYLYDFTLLLGQIKKTDYKITDEQREELQDMYDNGGIYPAKKILDGTIKEAIEKAGRYLE